MSRKKGTGSVITVRKLNGLGDVTEPDTYMGASLPPVIGGTVAALVTIAIEMWVRPTSNLQANLVKFAPWVGLLAAALASAAMSMMIGRPAALSAFSGAFVVSGALSASDWAAKAMMASNGMNPGMTGTGAVVAEYGGSRTGAVVPEYERRPGTGEIVMEKHADRGYGTGPLGDYGETVQLHGGQIRGAYGETVNVGDAQINKVFGMQSFGGQFG